MVRHVEPTAAEIDAQGRLGWSANIAHDRAGRNWGELWRGLGQDDIFGTDFVAEGAFNICVLIILSHCQDIWTDLQKVILEIEAELFAVADHDLIDHFECRHQRQFMILWDRGAALLVLPQYGVGSEADGEVAAERPRFAEKLNMSRVEDVIATRDEDFFHINKKGRIYPKKFVASNKARMTKNSNSIADKYASVFLLIYLLLEVSIRVACLSRLIQQRGIL